MDRLNNQDTYKVDIEINKKEVLKDLKEIENQVKSITKEIDIGIKHIRLRRKDILLVKLNGIFKEAEKIKVEKQLMKTLHRKVIVIDQFVEDVTALER